MRAMTAERAASDVRMSERWEKRLCCCDAGGDTVSAFSGCAPSAEAEGPRILLALEPAARHTAARKIELRTARFARRSGEIFLWRTLICAV